MLARMYKVTTINEQGRKRVYLSANKDRLPNNEEAVEVTAEVASVITGTNIYGQPEAKRDQPYYRRDRQNLIASNWG